ncbi:MAG: hypothetical protein ACI3VU_04085 [Faecousia sp.]
MKNSAAKQQPTNDGKNSLQRLEAVTDKLLERCESIIADNDDFADCLYQLKALVVMLDAVKVLSTVYEKIYDRMKEDAQQELVVRFESSEMDDFCC